MPVCEVKPSPAHSLQSRDVLVGQDHQNVAYGILKKSRNKTIVFIDFIWTILLKSSINAL